MKQKLILQSFPFYLKKNSFKKVISKKILFAKFNTSAYCFHNNNIIKNTNNNNNNEITNEKNSSLGIYDIPPPPRYGKKTIYLPPKKSKWLNGKNMIIGTIIIFMVGYKLAIMQAGENVELLNPDTFTDYLITHKVDYGNDIFLLEVSPTDKLLTKIKNQNQFLWNGKYIWSVEIKQPEIQISRRYTPLPIFVVGASPEKGVAFKVIQPKKIKKVYDLSTSENPAGEGEGKMTFIIKKYKDGEMSRWLYSLPVGSTLSLRGPYIDYKFPNSSLDSLPCREQMLEIPSNMKNTDNTLFKNIQSDNLSFFAGGTGISPILQVLLSYNPFRGHTTVYCSMRKKNEIPLPRLMYFLEKTGRAKFNYFFDEDNKFLSIKDIPKPSPMQELGCTRPTPQLPDLDNLNNLDNSIQSENSNKSSSSTFSNMWPFNRKDKEIIKPALALVCGPKGYDDFVAGPNCVKYDGSQGEIEGLLGSKGWNNENVFILPSTA